MRLSNKYWKEALKNAGIEVLEWRGEKDALLIGNNFNDNYLSVDPGNVIILQHTSIPGNKSRKFIKKARCVVAMSTESAIRLRGMGAKDVRIFYPYVPVDFRKAVKRKREGRIYVGRISVDKGIVETLAYLREVEEECHFYGDGDLVDLVKKHPFAKYCGIVQYEALPWIYNRYDIYTWRLSRYGGYGRTLVEAALCGLELDVNKQNFGIFREEDFNLNNSVKLRKRLDENLGEFVNFIKSQI